LGQPALDSSDAMPKLRLRRRDGGGGGAPTYELDLQQYPADVVFAWLRYLYTQDDLELTWPLRHSRRGDEEAPPEMWWMQLLHLAQLVGDWKLQLYAQETIETT
ncbi:CPK28, partial [Symbiodinium pilosum]